MKSLGFPQIVNFVLPALLFLAGTETVMAQAKLGTPRFYNLPESLTFTQDASPSDPEKDSPPELLPLPKVLTLADVTALALQQNPGLAQYGFQVGVAQGTALQSGLYPNPTLQANFDELGDRTGPGGINSILVYQEFVIGGKLRLSRAAAQQKVNQAQWDLVWQRYELITRVRQTFYQVLAAQERVHIYSELLELATKSFENAKKLVGAGEASKASLYQFEIQVFQIKANLEANQKKLQATLPKLAAVIGVRELPPLPLAGTITAIPPEYDLEKAQAVLVANHPAVQAAEAGIMQAQLELKRAQVEPIPNVTVGVGYVRQNQNDSNDVSVHVGLPIPVFNRNQGNILSAQAKLGYAQKEVGRVQFNLAQQFATAFAEYAAARKQAEVYRTHILPKAQEGYKLILAAFRGGQFEYLQVLQAQQAMAISQQEYVQAMSEQWQAAATLAGLLLQDIWPYEGMQAPVCYPGNQIP